MTFMTGSGASWLQVQKMPPRNTTGMRTSGNIAAIWGQHDRADEESQGGGGEHRQNKTRIKSGILPGVMVSWVLLPLKSREDRKND